MADALPNEMLDSAVDPSEVARQKFDLERRGFDQSQVRAYLIAVADALRDAQTRETEIRGRLGKAIRRAERAEAEARGAGPTDPAELTRQLGDEVAGVLDAARVAGEQKVSAAEKSAERLLDNAKTQAGEIRQTAESILAERKAEAEAKADELLEARRTEADALVDRAQKDAATMRKDAVADLERAKAEGDKLIAEAEAARLQILQDMDRRRRQARAQVERLRVGRDRLLRSYEVVRRTLDESTGELKGSLNEAKVLGDTAARRAAAEPASSPHQLEAEMADARLIRGDNSGPKRRRPTGTRPSSAGSPARTTAGAPKPASAPPAPPAKPTRNRTTQTPAPSASIKPSDIGLPHVELGAAGLHGDAAPSPRRPAMHESGVPRPPANAPTIKHAEPAEAITEAKAEVAAEASEELETEVETATAVATLPVPTVELDDSALDAAEHAALDEAAAEVDAKVLSEMEQLEQDLEDFRDLPVEELAIIDASDEIEEVVALVAETIELGDAEIITWVPSDTAEPSADTEPAVEPSADAAETRAVDEAEADEAESAPQPKTGLFAALRAQAEPEIEVADEAAGEVVEALDEAAGEVVEALDEAPESAEESEAEIATDELDATGEAELEGPPAVDSVDFARQRDAMVAELSKDLEKRLKRALADEQNDVLAGIRATKPKETVELISLVGETDEHVSRYVTAMTDVAASAYAAGAALLDREAEPGMMPAGAVEELLGTVVVLPLRLRLLELDTMSADSELPVDAIRAFYRQRKTDHLGEAAAALAGLLVTAGACDVLGEDEALPWLGELG
ncbi:MAG: ATP synthase F0 subunit B [Actinomycetota bacterium]